MNTPRPPRRSHGFSSTGLSSGTQWAAMMSSPSSATQRVYGESFSVANFAASWSLTIASLAIGPPGSVVSGRAHRRADVHAEDWYDHKTGPGECQRRPRAGGLLLGAGVHTLGRRRFGNRRTAVVAHHVRPDREAGRHQQRPKPTH